MSAAPFDDCGGGDANRPDLGWRQPLLPIPASKLATAQRNGINPFRAVASRPSSANALDSSTRPALHSAAARTTPLFTRCRTDDAGRGQVYGPSRMGDRGAGTGGHRQLRTDPRHPYRKPAGRFGPGVQALPGRFEKPCRHRKPAHAKRVGRQPDQGVDASRSVIAGQQQRTTIPAARDPVPAELPQQ